MTFLATMYEGRGGPFQGYPHNQVFAHGAPVKVADIAATSPAGSRSLVLQERWPAVFHSALVVPADAEERPVVFSTGSGDEAAELLHRLVAAFASADAQLYVDYADSVEQGIVRPTNEDGRLAWLYLTNNGWNQVLLEESYSLFGVKPATAFYTQDHQLAKDAAAAIADGMLDVTPANKSELAKFGL